MDLVRLGAIDIGSNSVRLLIMNIINDHGRIVFKKDLLVRIPLKLGEDTFSIGYITQEKLHKLGTLLQSYLSLLEINDVKIYKICATSAVREALNIEEVKTHLCDKIGIDIDVIDAKKEADYMLLNNSFEKWDRDKQYLFIDVGGGSTEMVLFQNNKETDFVTFRIGTVRKLTKMEEQEEWLRMEEWLHTHFNNFRKVVLVGSGGNINKLSSLLRRSGKIKREELLVYYRKLKIMTVEERVLNLDMGFNRALVIMPAIEIHLRVMRILKANAIETPIIGLADGIVKDMYFKEYNYSATDIISHNVTE